MADSAYLDGPSRVNNALCGFSNRWAIDGDYMRCRRCKRPQITNYMDARFQHAAGCRSAGKVEQHPWRTYLELMAKLITLSVAIPAQAHQDGGAIHG